MPPISHVFSLSPSLAHILDIKAFRLLFYFSFSHPFPSLLFQSCHFSPLLFSLSFLMYFLPSLPWCNTSSACSIIFLSSTFIPVFYLLCSPSILSFLYLSLQYFLFFILSPISLFLLFTFPLLSPLLLFLYSFLPFCTADFSPPMLFLPLIFHYYDIKVPVSVPSSKLIKRC